MQTSCTPILKLYYGYHDPRVEKLNSINKFAGKKKIDDSIILIPKNAKAFITLAKYLPAIPDLYLYNAKGEPLIYKIKEGCNAPVFDITNMICASKYLTGDSMISLKSFIDNVKPLNEEDSIRFEESLKKSVEFTSIITWSTNIGFLNKDHVRPWQESLKAQTDCPINSYLLNMDIIEEIFTAEELKLLGF